MSSQQQRYQAQQQVKERRQQQLTPLQIAIERWVADELPSLPPLEKQTLRHLTQTQGGEKLFNFLTTRVRSPMHTETIRANLLLHGAENADDPNETKDEIAKLRLELADAERRLSRVRDKVNQKQRQKLQKLQRPNKLQDGYAAIFPNTCRSTRTAARTVFTESLFPVRAGTQDATSALQSLQIEQENQGEEEENRIMWDDIHDLAQTTLFETGTENRKWQSNNAPREGECFESRAFQLQSDIEEIINGRGVPAVAKQLTAVARDIARCKEEEDEENINAGNEIDNKDCEISTDDHNALLRDALLRAGSAFKAVSKAATNTSTNSDVDALTYLSLVEKSNDEELDGMATLNDQDLLQVGQLRAQREATAEMSKKHVQDLQEVTQRLMQTCMALLDEATNESATASEMDGRLTKEVTRATDAAGRKAQLIERCIHEALTWQGEELELRIADQVNAETSCHGIDLEQEYEWKAECDRALNLIQVRINASLETRAAVTERFYHIINGKVEEGLRQAEAGKEDAVLTQKEMRNWATQPGIHLGRKILRGEFD